MAFNCCEKTFSCLFIFFNVVFSVFGLATLALGIYLKVEPEASELIKVVEIEDGAHYLTNGAWVIIGFGSLVLLVCCCGCVGAATKSKCLLGLYICFSVIIVIGEIAALAITIIMVVRIDDVNTFQSNLTAKVQNEYKSMNESSQFRDSWDYLQKTFKCCGVAGYKDFDVVYTGADKDKVPASCCTASGGMATNSTGHCKDMHQKGCFELLRDKVHEYSDALFIFEAIVMVVTIIGIIIAVCLCKRSGEKV
ncbi:CD82 antigen-like [Haliotis rubra]|uniref:CD82 antigen-like n=1 Tax=Haliotis rubra TaxID=36100 RepID=UPI001EE61B93|nr:CD82 antigen-like [Haliotis rubra]